jgi:formylglycine-generating enzyme required for sulfatase activity
MESRIPDQDEFVNSLGMRITRIPSGTFTMGFEGSPLRDEIVVDDSQRRAGDFDERPRHKVGISKPFYMASCPVTNAQYEVFDSSHRDLRGAGILPFRKTFAQEIELADQMRRFSYSSRDEEAVVSISWEDAKRFCDWLSTREGLPYRLPTESEWEYACRAGTTTAFYTGDLPPEECMDGLEAVSRGEAADLTVAKGDPNPWGLFDMHGNVEEWCHDWYGPYSPDEQVDPVGMADGDFKVTRGGSHSTEMYYLRSANRMGTIPEDKHWLIGLRVAVGEKPGGAPLPPPPPQIWQRDVPQSRPVDIFEGPDQDEPFFASPRVYVKIPDGAEGPLFWRHNHDPGLAKCPNGDLLAIWYTCFREPGRELALAASRLRYGADEWDSPAPFWDAPDRNDHAPSLWFDGGSILYHFNGLSTGAGYRNNLALVMRTSTDNGVTWSKASFVNPERGVPSQPVACVIGTDDGKIIFVSDAPHAEFGRGSVLWTSGDEGRTWSVSEGAIAGIHAGVVKLRDGGLMALGRGVLDDMMPMSLSSDMGGTWTYQATQFPAINGGQRLVLMRLREGPLLLCSFTGPRREYPPMPVTDASGRERPVRGLFAALSFDEGRTWPRIRLISDDGPDRELETMDGKPFTMGFETAEPEGYLAGVQTENGLIHLISSKQHYSFNLKWAMTPPPVEPVTG